MFLFSFLQCISDLPRHTMSFSQKLTILFAPIHGVGHVNACLGIAEKLRDRGHKVVFATPNDWKGNFEPQKFLEECYSTQQKFAKETKTTECDDAWGEIASKFAPALAMSPEDQIGNFLVPIVKEYEGNRNILNQN